MKKNIFLEKYGDWAVITGASEGIGKEFAISLASRGFNLILIARRKELLENLQKKLSNDYGNKNIILSLDLNDISSTDKILDEIKKKKIGLFVGSAGFGTSGLLINSNIESEIEMINVNCRSLMVLSYYFGKIFANQKRGGIILLSSIVAFQGVANQANYAATKAFVQSLAEGLNQELKQFNVDVISSAPGPVDTGFASRSNLKMGNAEKASVVAEVTLKSLGNSLTVRPGFLAKLLGYSLKTVPRFIRIKIMSSIMFGMTKHQR